MNRKENLWVGGPGGALPSTRGKQIGSAYFAEYGDGWAQFDAGFGTWNAGGRIKAVDAADVNALILTHLHADHVGDAVTTMHGIQLLSEKKYGAILPLEIFGPAGIKKAVLDSLVWLGAPDYRPNFIFHEGPGEYGSIRLFPVAHNPLIESVAAILYGDDVEITYTGDINSDFGNFEAILDATENPGILVTEATEPNNRYHITATSAETLSQAGKYKLTVIGHTRRNHKKTVKDICRRSGGRIVAAVAGLGVTAR